MLRLGLPSLPISRVLTTARNRRPCRAWMSWSSGKDSVFALHTARQAGIEVLRMPAPVTALAARPVGALDRSIESSSSLGLYLLGSTIASRGAARASTTPW